MSQIRLTEANGEDRTLPLNEELYEMMMGQARMHVDRRPSVFHREGERIRSFAKAWHTACDKAGHAGKLIHDLRRTGVRNLVRAGVPRYVVVKISGRRDARIFARYNKRCDGNKVSPSRRSVR